MSRLLQAGEPWYVAVNTSGANTATLKAAVSGKEIVVTSYSLTTPNGASDCNVTFQSDATAISGIMPLVAETTINSAEGAVGLFRTVKGEALKITKSANVDVDGHIAGVLI